MPGHDRCRASGWYSAKFAKPHGALVGCIQLIRQKKAASGTYFARLEINDQNVIKRLLPLGSNAQLDALFDEPAA